MSSNNSSIRSATPPRSRLYDGDYTHRRGPTTFTSSMVALNEPESISQMMSSMEYGEYKTRHETHMVKDGRIRMVSCPQNWLDVNKCCGVLRFFADYPGGPITSSICSHVCSTRTCVAIGGKKCFHCGEQVEKVKLPLIFSHPCIALQTFLIRLLFSCVREK